MYIIAGLGNPGKEYAHTKHNAGFDVIDFLADKYDIAVDTEKFKAVIGKGMIGSRKVILAKPLTFMNLSGESIRALCDYFKIDVSSELIVIYDDIDLQPSYIRVKERGSAGGHNGIKSIIGMLGTEEFMRIRVGIGEKPKGYDLAAYVLSRFSDKDRELMEDGIVKALDAAELMVSGEVSVAMNKYNKKVKRIRENEIS